MDPSSRLDRLARLVQADLHALPDRPAPPPVMAMLDDEDSGGVPLGEESESYSAASEHSAKPTPITNPAPLNALTNTERRFVLVRGVQSSYYLAGKPPSVGHPTSSATIPAPDPQRGDLVVAGHYFTPILALAKYPYKFCHKSHLQDIASAFFDAGKFWNRVWDLYYIWDTDHDNPMILVHESQFQQLLEEINTRLALHLRITDAQREEGLVCRFPDHPACLPRYLGRSHTREQYEDTVSNVPDSSFLAASECTHEPLDSDTLEQFKQIMATMWDAQQRKNKAKRVDKLLERIGRQESMVDQLKRAQRYLGLRAAAESHMLPGLSRAVDPSNSAPFIFEKSVVFICVDVESYERAHHKITEVGVATLDTRDLVDVAPGQDGEGWRKLIKARHFRINEHRHLVNREFVIGRPDSFNFGESTFINLNEASTDVAACFNPPFAAHPSNTAEDEIHTTLSKLDPNEQRNLVLLGHDTQTDIRYLHQLAFDPTKLNNMLETMDTAKMYQAWRREPQPTSLAGILNDFKILPWNLHNAGNDAVYTLQAMLAICVREAAIRCSTYVEVEE